jgi:hypothetical protein
VVCGGDSDLILQCMLSGAAHRLHICQECRGQKPFENYRYLLWDVDKLVHLIMNSSHVGSNKTMSASDSSVSDSPPPPSPAFPLFRRLDRKTDPPASYFPTRPAAASPAVGLGQRLDISMLFIFQGML